MNVTRLSASRNASKKRMLTDWSSAALQTSRKCGRYVYRS